jgi:hypothetical protein
MSTSDKRYFQHTLHYFPSIENDASRITWAHAVNSRQKLEEALKSEFPRGFNPILVLLEFKIGFQETKSHREL